MRIEQIKVWCVVGDFNAVRKSSERKGVNVMVRGT